MQTAFLILLTKEAPDGALAAPARKLKAAAERAGADRFSLWRAKDLVFGYVEAKGEEVVKEAGEAVRTAFSMDWSGFSHLLASPGNMRLMYRVVTNPRETTDGLFYRVFMTRLKPGSAEEYLKRHAELQAVQEAREKDTPSGEMNNFTIWNAGDYICGYNELEKPAEKPDGPVPKSPWEVRMLEIMDWITDDVDAMFGFQNEAVRRLA